MTVWLATATYYYNKVQRLLPVGVFSKVMTQRLGTYFASWSRLMILSAASTSSLTIPSPSSMLISVPISPRLGPLIPFTCVCVCVCVNMNSITRMWVLWHTFTLQQCNHKQAYLVKLVWSNWFNIATWYVNLLPVIIEIDTSHAVQDGPHHTSLTSKLARLKELNNHSVPFLYYQTDTLILETLVVFLLHIHGSLLWLSLQYQKATYHL